MGAIEDVLLDEEFTEMQNDFCRRYCGQSAFHAHYTCDLNVFPDEFDDEDENKIIYTDIFQQFTTLIGNM